MNEKAGQFHASHVFLDAESFAKLTGSSDMGQITAAWLSALAGQAPSVRQGLVVLAGTGQTRFEPAAMWPRGATPTRELMAAVNGAVKSRRMIIETTKTGGAAVGIPVMLGDQLRGAVAVLSEAEEGQDQSSLPLVIDQLKWASGWIEAALRRQRVTGSDNLVTVIELLATSLHHRRFAEAATAVATELSGALGCELVAVGLLRGRHNRVRALSNSATFGKRANLVRGIEAAMDEAVDQQAVITYPATDKAAADPLTADPDDTRNTVPDRVTRAHRALSKLTGDSSFCTVPLTEQGRLRGALLLQRPEGETFDKSAVEMAQYAALLVGPVLDIKRREDRWLITKAGDSVSGLFGAIFGPRHAALKLGLIVLTAVALFFWFATGTYRVTANAVVEGRIQRVVTAPLAGFLALAEVRAGDPVSKGQLMARIDDRDIRLERLKWFGERTKQRQEYSQAMAQRDRTKARILSSQIEQAEAQIALLDQQLERMQITAPFDGVVVSGDLTQALGAPLERGDVLFEVAPLDEYRVILRVDERDISDVSKTQSGPLVLSALPDTPYRVAVTRITPISSTEAGANFFQVEASVTDGPITDLRPGMEGVAKVEVEERRLLSIWTRRLVLWARMTFWSWRP